MLPQNLGTTKDTKFHQGFITDAHGAPDLRLTSDGVMLNGLQAVKDLARVGSALSSGRRQQRGKCAGPCRFSPDPSSG